MWSSWVSSYIHTHNTQKPECMEGCWQNLNSRLYSNLLWYGWWIFFFFLKRYGWWIYSLRNSLDGFFDLLIFILAFSISKIFFCFALLFCWLEKLANGFFSWFSPFICQLSFWCSWILSMASRSLCKFLKLRWEKSWVQNLVHVCTQLTN